MLPVMKGRSWWWWLFAALLAVWTWKLVEPNPLPAALEQGLPGDWRFWLSKLAHAGVYALLAVVGRQGWGPRGRQVVVLVLLLHAVGTELAQTYVPNRHGSVRDVVIDWFGIVMGTLAECWWRRQGRSGPSLVLKSWYDGT